MSYSIFLTDDAVEDISSAIDWYNQQKDGLGTHFYDELWKAFERIQQMPFAFPIKFKHLRACPTKRFPYLIYYNIVEDKKTVEVIAVLHTKMDAKGRLT